MTVCAELAAALSAAVTVVHVTVDPVMVVPPVAPTEAMITPPVLSDQALRDAEAAGQGILARAAAALRARGVEATHRQPRGPVALRVVELAREVQADLIVLGSRGHGRSHVMPALIPPYATIPVIDGSMALGTWQSICLVDLNVDNGERQVRLSFVPSAN